MFALGIPAAPVCPGLVLEGDVDFLEVVIPLRPDGTLVLVERKGRVVVEVEVDLVDAGFVPAMRSARTDVRSNMVNGMPRRKLVNVNEVRNEYRPD